MESLDKGDAVADLLENENEVQNDDRGDSILKKEFEKALRGLKTNKAPGVDLIAAELLLRTSEEEHFIKISLWLLQGSETSETRLFQNERGSHRRNYQ